MISDELQLPIVALFPLAFVVVGLMRDSPQAIGRGLLAIVGSRDTLVTDYMGLGGVGAALVHAGLLTLLAIGVYRLSGAVIGGAAVACLMLVLGFGLFGKSLIVPVMAGVLLASLTKTWGPADPPVVLAALFGTTLAPIAGRFGWHWGIVAGVVHGSVAQSVGQVHGGLVLYNNGFAAGLVASVLVPVILALQPRSDNEPGS